MAADSKSGIQGLRHALGLVSDELDVVRLARLIGLFMVGSTLLLALWTLIDPVFGGGTVSIEVRIRLFWVALVTPTWAGVVIILLAELVDRAKAPVSSMPDQSL